MDYMTQLANRIQPLFKTPPRSIVPNPPSEITADELTLLQDIDAQICLMRGGKERLTSGSEQILAELIAEALFRKPALAQRASALADWYPDYITMLAHRVRSRQSSPAWSARLFGFLPRPRDKSEVAELCAELIGDPGMVLQLARELELSVPFALVLHDELEEVNRSRGFRFRMDEEARIDQVRVEMIRTNRALAEHAALNIDTAETMELQLTREALQRDLDRRMMAVRGRTAESMAEEEEALPPPPPDPAVTDGGTLSNDPPPGPGIAHPSRAAAAMNLLGVSLSGGGIRSATFNLGVLQGLARLDVLRKVDYLATVSGGGYIGGWLASLVSRNPKGIRGVQRVLSPDLSPDPEAEAARPIRFLREYSNYLTPRKGFLSADTWTMIAIWLRNTFLSQLVLVLFLGAVLLIPRGPAALLFNAIPTWPAIILAGFLLLLAAWFIGFNLRWFDPQTSARYAAEGKNSGRFTQQGMIQLLVVIPTFLAAVLLVRPLITLIDRRTSDLPLWGIASGAVFFFLLLIQFHGEFHRCFYAGDRAPGGWIKFKASAWVSAFSLIAAAVTGGVLVVLTRAAQARFSCPDLHRACISKAHQIVLGPSIILLVVSCATVIQIGLLGRNFPDERREWWSRLGAWIMIYSLLWSGLFGIAIYGPLLVGKMGAWATGGALAAWLATATGGVMVAKSPKTGAAGSAKLPTGAIPKKLLVGIAPYIFVLGLLLIVATGLLVLLGAVPFHSDSTAGLWATLQARYDFYFAEAGYLWPVWFCLGFGVLALLLAQRVDVNEFSMHHFYKNRLVRCYLGSTRPARERHPNRFTGFDLGDDTKLAALVYAKEYRGPYPVLNTALNLVKGDDLAAQERKAASFVFTPMYSGFEYVDRRPDAQRDSNLAGEGYRQTERYGYAKEGGIGLGTAVAISGAAASPNQGYHSSPAASFLMTMFNARLGWWLGNPRHARTSGRSSPGFGLLYYLNDLLGNTTDRSWYVNLSDGGHFDNLGLYELVRRRCRYIIACDAEQDGDLTFGALGNAVRKCRTDFGVNIILEPERIRPLAPGTRSKVHCVVGTIVYQDGQCGTLVYLKSSLTGDEQADVLEYALRRQDFPHQSTANQWFDESQFESYRALGYHVALTTFGRAAEARRSVDTRRFFDYLEAQWYPTSEAERLPT